MHSRRAFHRLEFHAPAFVVDGDRTVFGELLNISNHGMYVQTSARLVEQSIVEITVYFNEPVATASITVPVTVVRSDTTGFGVYSPQISVSSFLGLRSLLACSAGDDATMFSEFYRLAESTTRALPPIPRYH